ncbi:glycosyltransferase family 2 protein [Leeuwenhoekiella polynyae]|uniref:Glycosyl transferase family 2 n=1 Tax=Leeuwenhoekiella polynyae TaxID=1550906 RepID=A0A4V1KRJ9_9FLAO|nr:glycosyltransferase [Leeuwenhoekiella polynyae]RXG25172.1 glycosyl transferase family 2 [Leeuwenhoekiella polynyae]
MDISVVIRNKNQSQALEFLLKNLTSRYSDQINEIIVLDNCSIDLSSEIAQKYQVRFETIEKFSYGGSANTAAQLANFPIVVIFSAHAYPVSHDFFTLISLEFEKNQNLAGVRCIHNPNDYVNYIDGVSSQKDPNKSGLIFCGSAFNKKVWQKHKFKSDITTFEDKEWSVRVLKAGYDIVLAPAIFCYDIKRTKKQQFFRYKNELIGAYQLWHKDISLKYAIKSFLGSCLKIFSNLFSDLYYTVKKLIIHLKLLIKRPDKF